MHFRRKIALALSGVVLAVPALTSCGFDYATDRPYTPAAGVNNQDGTVDVLGAVIVSGQDDSGTFIASFSNNDVDEEGTVESLTGAEGTTLEAESFEPIVVPPSGLLSLADEGGIPVTGSFTAGDFVPVTITFGNGEQSNLEIPVVSNDGDFAGLDTSASSASPSETPSDAASPSEPATESPTESPSASPSE
jgi:hypothetical protein